MADKFDPYREALVLETETVWPDDFASVSADRRADIERQLHASAAEAADLTYFRTHTGFCRQITVTDADLERLGESVEA